MQNAQADADPANRALVPGRCVRVSSETAKVAVPRPGSGPEPVVELVRQGDLVQAIDVTCGCGKRIRLRCVYAP